MVVGLGMWIRLGIDGIIKYEKVGILNNVTMLGNLKVLSQALIDDFQKVIALAEMPLPSAALSFEILTAPHKPPTSLTNGKVAVYVFIWKGNCLKVGKVGPKSHARFTSQHYSPSSSQSNLAKSILADRNNMGLNDLTEFNVGDWIKTNVDRVNIFISVEQRRFHVLNLLEAFLQCRLQPRFEGFESQR